MRAGGRACAGARIHSNSWGANINAYTLPTADVDEFMHSFDEMLILFAAGNSGQEGPGSIGAPATCKNCLTVGASENYMDPPQPCSRTPPRACPIASWDPFLVCVRTRRGRKSGMRAHCWTFAAVLPISACQHERPVECQQQNGGRSPARVRAQRCCAHRARSLPPS